MLSSMAQKISETESFVNIANEEVSNTQGSSYEIVNFKNENGTYTYNVNVLNENEETIKEFKILTWLSKDSTKVHFGKE